MLDVQRSNLSGSDQQFLLSLLFGITLLALALQTPQGEEAVTDFISGADLPNLERVAEFRPQGPPPGVESDQTTADEAPEVYIVPANGRNDVRSGGLRERPGR